MRTPTGGQEYNTGILWKNVLKMIAYNNSEGVSSIIMIMDTSAAMDANSLLCSITSHI